MRATIHYDACTHARAPQTHIHRSFNQDKLKPQSMKGRGERVHLRAKSLGTLDDTGHLESAPVSLEDVKGLQQLFTQKMNFEKLLDIDHTNLCPCVHINFHPNGRTNL